MSKTKNEKFFEEAIQGFVNFWDSADSNTTDDEFEKALEKSFQDAEKKLKGGEK